MIAGSRRGSAPPRPALSRLARAIPGLSLLELIIALVITAIGILPVFGVFLSSGDSIRQTGPYHAAVFLSELAIEEARLGADEDPYFPDRLLVDGLGAERVSVLRGEHPFLAGLEDSIQPWGRTEPRKDLDIRPELGPLYGQSEPLSMALEATDTEDLVRIRVHLDWIDRRGTPGSFMLSTPLREWTPLRRIEEPSRGPGTPPSSDAQNLALLIDLSRRVAGLPESRRRMLEAIAERWKASRAPNAMGLRLLREARVHENDAAEALLLLQEMRPLLERIAAGIDRGSLDAVEDLASMQNDAIRSAASAFSTFQSSLRRAAERAGEASRQPALSMMERLVAHQLILRVLKMDCLTRPWRDRAPLKSLLGNLIEHYRHRIPHAAHHLEIEAAHVDRLDDPDVYPLRVAAEDVMNMRRLLAQAFLSIRRYAPLPGDGSG